MLFPLAILRTLLSICLDLSQMHTCAQSVASITAGMANRLNADAAQASAVVADTNASAWLSCKAGGYFNTARQIISAASQAFGPEDPGFVDVVSC